MDESVPPYQRIANDLEADIASGRLAPGARVPSLNRLAQEYGVAKNTVIKAIDVLESKGLVRTQQGWGTFVRQLLPMGAPASFLFLSTPVSG